jgi:hypothetical protein
MDRKAFITTTVGGVAAVAATSASMAAAATPGPAQIDSNRNLRFMKKIVDALIEDLNDDAHDYGGHRANAVSNLQNASAELQQAINYLQAHSGY